MDMTTENTEKPNSKPTPKQKNKLTYSVPTNPYGRCLLQEKQHSYTVTAVDPYRD